MAGVKTISVCFSAAADGRSVTFDRDSVIVGLTGSAGLLSSRPDATIANTVTAPANETRYDVIGRVSSGFPMPVIEYEVSAGETLFVSSQGAGVVCIHLRDTISGENT